MRSWWGEGVGSRIAFVFSVDIRPAYFHAVVSVAAGVAFADPLLGSHMVDTVPLCWVPLRCRVPCRVPFTENVGCCVAEMIPAVGIMSISGGWSAVPAIAVFGSLGVTDIAVGGGAGGPLMFLFWCCPIGWCACICTWCGCCICIALIAGPPWPTDAI